MPKLDHRGVIAIIIATALALILVIMAVSVALGVQISESGRDAAWALVGGLAGALVTYVGTRANGKPPPTPPNPPIKK